MTTTALASPLDRLDTLPRFPVDGRVLTLAPAVIAWAEDVLIQPNGRNAGKKFQFTPRQLRFLMWWYAVDDEGRWLFQHGVRRLAKGSGKSPFAAVLALCEFCGPVRVRDIDSRRRIVLGQPQEMPWVQIAATSEAQTGNTMRMVRAFAPKGSPIVARHLLDPGKVKYYKLPEGTLEVLTSSATSAEGAEASFVIADETEHWKPNNGGDDLADVLADNLAKSGNRMLETSNAWEPGTESVAEATWDAWVAQEEGRLVPEAGLILYDAVISRPDLDWYDAASVRDDLARIYADCHWTDLDAQVGRIFSPRSKLSESKRKYGNRPTVAEDAWVDPAQWSALYKPGVEVKPGEPVALFFDGSKSRDATALIGCRISDGHVFVVDIWEPHTAHTTESVVPVAQVDERVRWAAEQWTVLGFFGDVQEWESFVQVEWPKVFPKLIVKAVPGGKQPWDIAWDMRTHVYEFTQGCELTESEIVDGKFTHDGDPRLGRHVGNARRRPNRYGVSIGKESNSSPHKIDGAVCVVGARHVRRLVMASPKWKRYARRANGGGGAVF